MSRLVVVSNRIALPDDKKSSAGGLAVGILGALRAAGGLWFGWSGEIGDDQQPLKQVSRGNISGRRSTLMNGTMMNTTTSSLTPCCGRLSTIVLIWSAFSAKPGRDICGLTPCWRTSFCR